MSGMHLGAAGVRAYGCPARLRSQNEPGSLASPSVTARAAHARFAGHLPLRIAARHSPPRDRHYRCRFAVSRSRYFQMSARIGCGL